MDKISSLRKEKEEVQKEIEKAKEAEAATQAAAEKTAAEKAAAEKAAAEKAAAAATVTTTTVVTETVTTTVKEEDEKQPEKKEEKKELSAAEKLLAKLKKNYPTEDNNKTEVKVTEVKTDNNTSLIDKFLQDSPHLDRNKEVAAGDMGQDSIKQPELASEKLAKIYITQKLFDKAIASYTKLVKDYPDKSEYFNAKIREIENMKNNQ